jgi:hypothetical protein
LGYEVQNAIEKDLDAKILITSHNSKPGLSKTTLALQMARQWDPHGWNADDKAFMDVFEYRDAYLNEEPGSVLLFDEIEDAADNRRGNSKENVELSQAWAQLRYRNMVTICTLPTVTMLDKRMIEMSDYWINVIWRGVAHPYNIYVNDFDGSISRVRMGPENNAVLKYPDVPDGDEDYETLTQMKRQNVEIDRRYIKQDEHDSIVEREREKAQTAKRDEIIQSLAEQTDLRHADIGSLDGVDVSRQRIGQITN